MIGGATHILTMASNLAPVRSGASFDVIVAGGGASGLMAAVSAARIGARVLVINPPDVSGERAPAPW